MKQIQIQVELGNVHKSVDMCIKKYKKKDNEKESDYETFFCYDIDRNNGIWNKWKCLCR